jgi:hypothetical protein
MVRRSGVQQSFLDEKVSPARLEPAGAGAARLIAAAVPDPLPTDEVSLALRALDRFEALPAELRSGTVARWMSDTVGRWDRALSGTDDARASARLRLLEIGSRVLRGGAGRTTRRTACEREARVRRTAFAGVAARRDPPLRVARATARCRDEECKAHCADRREGRQRARGARSGTRGLGFSRPGPCTRRARGAGQAGRSAVGGGARLFGEHRKE